MNIEFFVPGEAKTAGSKRAFKHKTTGKVIVTHDNPKTKTWMDSVKWFAMKQLGSMCLITGPVSLSLVFYRERPKGHFGTGGNTGTVKESAPELPGTKPDSLKLGRAVEDALTGIIYKDDSQVCHHDIRKVYCCGDEKPGVKISIKVIENILRKEPQLWQKENQMMIL